MKIPANALGIAILTGAFALSVIQFARISLERSAESEDGGKVVVRLTHWQLEPGYREALQDAIDAYNRLPHVLENNVEVRQNPISEKVYGQFLNVHLISGTAPDLSVKGLSRLVRTGSTGKYFEPLGEVADQPNPYNAPELLPDDLDPELAELLSTAPWRETFIDGMLNGWDYGLKGYYAVPVSTFGTTRIFYNKRLMAEAKALVRDALETPGTPAWMEPVILRNTIEGLVGYLPINDHLRAWAATDAPPQTLGQLLLICEAVRAYAHRTGQDKLAPIAGSEHSARAFRDTYLVPFTSSLLDSVDRNADATIDILETYTALETGKWDFDDPRVKAYFECIRAISEQFPPGFLGLDRDQANRRFVLGKAVMIATGGFDAASIFAGAQEKARAADVFEVGIMPFPIPGPGERWHKYITSRASEVESVYGVPFAVYRLSPNKKWAIDFLQFLTSFRVNEAFNKDSGWLPFVIGAAPSQEMAPFSPDPAGTKSSSRLAFIDDNAPNPIHTRYKGRIWLYASGDLPYEDFVADIRATVQSERNGLDRLWYERWRTAREEFRAKERALAVQEASVLFDDAPSGADLSSRYRALLLDSMVVNNNQNLPHQWSMAFPGKPFPADF